MPVLRVDVPNLNILSQHLASFVVGFLFYLVRSWAPAAFDSSPYSTIFR
jgi:hypothetical protein